MNFSSFCKYLVSVSHQLGSFTRVAVVTRRASDMVEKRRLVDSVLRPVYTKCQTLTWSVNACIVADQLGLQPIFRATCWVY